MEATARKPALGFIFVTLVLIVLGFGILIPVLPGLVTEFDSGSVARASRSYGWLVGVYGAMQFIASPILGSLSDRFGRRKVILIALTGSAIDYVIMGLAPGLGWLFVARMVSGMTAGALATCNAYVADVLPPEKRAQGFGLLGAAFGLGFVIGPAIGGFLGQINLRLPFFAAAGCVGLNALYGLFILPESLPPERRRAFSWARANPIGSFSAMRRFRGVSGLTWMYFIYMSGQFMLQSVWVLYTTYRFNWDTRAVGLSMTFVGIATAAVQGRFVRPVISRIGERAGLILGLLICAVIMVCYGVATRGWMLYVMVLFGSWGGIAGPATQALITRHVPHNEHGAVQGSIAGMTSLAQIFSPILASWSFSAGISGRFGFFLPGIAFFEGSVLSLVALGMAFLCFRRDDRLPPVEAGLPAG